MKKHTVVISVTLMLAMLFLASGVRADRLTVVASVFPLYEFARAVGGQEVQVNLLLPPGVDPHSWEPKPSDILKLSRADIFLYISDGMEPWAGSIAAALTGDNLLIVPVLDRLGLTRSNPGAAAGEDPHFWLDLSLSKRTVKMIEELFRGRDPANGNRYAANSGIYATRLDRLDAAFTAGLKQCASRHLVTGGHAAFGYMVRRYGLEQTSVYGLSPDAEPTPRHLAAVVSAVKKYGVSTIFSEELVNPRMAEVLSRETGANVVVLNPGGNLTAAQWREGMTFLDLMGRNLENLREGLHCE